jgi:PAS domain S-box-containing protein
MLLLLTALIPIFLTTASWIYSEKVNTARRIDTLKEHTLQAQKDDLKKEVDRVIDYLEFINSDSLLLSSDKLKDQALNYLKDIRFGNDGYIFVNTYSGFALLFDGDKTDGERKISDLTDPDGLKIFQKELELATIPEGGYFEYLFKKLDDTIPQPKISYIRGYSRWDWIIGTGDYFDNIDSEIQQIEDEFQAYLRDTYLTVASILFIVLLLMILLGTVVARLTQKEFNRFISIITQNIVRGEPDPDINHFLIRELRTIGLDVFQTRGVVRNFGDIIEYSQNEIYIFRLSDLQFIHANQGALNNSGYSLDDLKQLTPSALLSDISNSQLITKLDTLRDGVVDHVRFETELVRKDRSTYSVEAHITTTDFYQEPVFVTFIHDISIRREAERGLKSSMKRYSGLFENAPISLWEEDFSELLPFLDKQLAKYKIPLETLLEKYPEILVQCIKKIRIIDVNKMTLQLYEADSKKELLENLDKTFSNKSLVAFKQIVIALYKRENIVTIISQNITLKGREIDIQINISNLSDDEAHTNRVILSIIDFTNLQIAEKELRSSEARFRSIFENNHSIMLLIDPENGRFIDVNQAALDYYGYSFDKFTGGMSVYDINLESREETDKNLKKVKATDKEYFTFKHRLSTGEIRDVEIYTGQLQYEAKTVFLSIVHDITETLKNREVLKEAKEKLESIFRAAPIGIGVVSTRIFTEVNDRFCEILGYTEKELIGKESRLVYVTDEEFERVGEIKYGQIETSGTGSVETKFRRKDGQIIDVILSSTPLDLDDLSKGVSFTALDITKRKIAELDLIKALKKATESDRLKSSFLATMSHELRTPLNAIIGFSDIMAEVEDPKTIDNYASIINSSGKHLLRLVEDVLNISLIESGESKLVLENCQVLPLLSEVHKIITYEQQHQNKQHLVLKMVVPPNEENLVLNTDPSKLKQILINLLKNALKFTPEGEIEYGFTRETNNGKEVITFYVSDTGIGISKAKSKIIFEMFRQGDESFSRTFGGAGIGLTISKKLAQHLGGDLWMESKKGKGSIFYFTVPISDGKDVTINTVEEVIDNSSGTYGMRTVLIVEDDETSYEFLKFVLEKEGINILWAKNGLSAIQTCKEREEIDLVLMDINLPELNGYDATKEIKIVKPDLPIVAQTSYAMAGDREKTAEAGCDDYISKPINRELLFKILDRFLLH